MCPSFMMLQSMYGRRLHFAVRFSWTNIFFLHRNVGTNLHVQLDLFIATYALLVYVGVFIAEDFT